MNTQRQPSIRLTQVVKHYGSVLALDQISMAAVPGRVLGLLGRNGAGKSTVIGLLIGQLKADQGDVTVLGATPPFSRDTRRRIGIAPQRLALYESLTVAENLLLFGSLYGLTGAALRDRIRQVAHWLELQPVASRRIQRCSGGMKRRANLAVALLPDADLVLMDEPTAGVDVQSREIILTITREIAAAGKTVIYTTHYIEEADKICDDIVFLHQGKIIDCGDKAALLARHGGESRIHYLDKDDVPHTVRAANPGDFVRRQVEGGCIMKDLCIVPPNLEDVFVRLIGEN